MRCTIRWIQLEQILLGLRIEEEISHGEMGGMPRDCGGLGFTNTRLMNEWLLAK
jgi:hypothetical protein